MRAGAQLGTMRLLFALLFPVTQGGRNVTCFNAKEAASWYLRDASGNQAEAAALLLADFPPAPWHDACCDVDLSIAARIVGSGTRVNISCLHQEFFMESGVVLSNLPAVTREDGN